MENIKVKELRKGMLVRETYRRSCGVGIDMTIDRDASLIEGRDDRAWKTEGITKDGEVVELMSAEGSEHYGPFLWLLANA